MSEATQMRKLWRARRSGIADPVAWGMVILVVLFVLGWHLVVLASRPAHLRDIAAEAGALGEFFGTPVATADGSRVAFFRGTETGGGLFVCDVATRQQRLLCEDAGNRRHAVLGWSPEGRLVASGGTKNDKDSLVICDADSGKVEATIVTYSPVKELAWLSPSSFVFLKGSTMLNTPKGGLMRVDKQADSEWSEPYPFAKLERTAGLGGTNATPYVPIKGLCATSTDSVAWHARNALWEWKSGESVPVRLWRGSSKNRIIECDYSVENGAFLLLLAHTNSGSIASYTPGMKQPVELGNVQNLGITNVVWVNHGKGYAYLFNESGLHSIFIKADSTDEHPVQSFTQDGVRVFTSGGGSIYAVGSLENQPKGVVEFDALSGAAKYLVPSSAHFRYSKDVVPSEGVLTNSLGERHAYCVWSPVNFNPRKKYPLVLTQGIHIWNEYAEAVANAGGYYVSVERPEFNHPQIEHWPEDVMAAYQAMTSNPNIDTNSVFICGASEETEFVVKLFDEKPALWKGVVLTSPTALPDLSQVGDRKIIINCGDADEYGTFARIRTFQENAARAGIRLTVAAHHTGHVFVSALANEEGVEEFVKFLFD